MTEPTTPPRVTLKETRTRPLPESLDGIKVIKRMVQHLNFGRDGGGGSERYYEADGEPLPFTQQWRVGSRKPGVNFTGMFLGGLGPMTVDELRAAWPDYVKATPPVDR